jgi:hypothetical protein
MATDEDGQRASKRAMLFLSEHNPLWRCLRAYRDEVGGRTRDALDKDADNASSDGDGDSTFSLSERAVLLGVSRPTATNWRDGIVLEQKFRERLRRIRNDVNKRREQSDSPLSVAAQSAAKTIVERIDAFLASKGNDSALSAGVGLGLSRDGARRALDEAYAERYPLFRGPYFQTRKAADDELANFKGLHTTLLFRGDLILQCPTRFRYVVRQRTGFSVRVKLNVPVLAPTPDSQVQVDTDGAAPEHTEYDGWIMLAKPGRLFITFETRLQDSRSDCLTMILESYPKRQWRLGQYMTVDQDNAQTIVSCPLLMQHQPGVAAGPDDEEARTRYMRQAMRVVKRGDPQFSQWSVLLDDMT